MSSVNKIVKGKAGVEALTVIITAVLALIVVFVLIYLNVNKAGAASKFACKVGLGVGEGYCISDKEKCDGITNPLGSGCPKEKPICCIGKAPKDTSGEGAAKPVGTVEFHCKCKLENGYLVPTTDNVFNKIEFPDTKAGGVDFKVKKDTVLEMQIKGTDAVKFCRMEIKGARSSLKNAVCNAQSGPSVTFKFDQPGEFDITLDGYDKQNGNLIASSTGDVSIDIVFDLYDNGKKITEDTYSTTANSIDYELSCKIDECLVEVSKGSDKTPVDYLDMGFGGYSLDAGVLYTFTFKYKEGQEWKIYKQYQIQQLKT